MVANRLRLYLCVGVAIGLTTFAGWSYAQKKATIKTPAELLPADAVFYLRVDGNAGHEEAYQQTAAYEAIVESGLAEVYDKLLESLSENEESAGLAGVIEHLVEHGFSLAISVDAPKDRPAQVWGTIVVPFAAEGIDLLETLITRMSDEKIEVRQTKVKGRAVRYVDLQTPLAELGWWKQGESLVLAVGMDAISRSLAVADEERPNITSHRLWGQYSKVDDDFDVMQTSWVDFESLRKSFADKKVPLPEQPDKDPPTIGQILEILGLHTLDHAALLSGYLGDSLWTEMNISAPGERTGLLALMDQETFTIEDLPAIPLQNAGVIAFSFDFGKAVDSLLQIARSFAELAPNGDAGKIDEGLAEFEEEFGFSLPDLMNSFGGIHCLYADTAQSLFGLGTVTLTQVADQDKLISCMQKLLSKLEDEANSQRPGQIVIRKFDEEDRTDFRMEFPQAPFITPTFSIGENWMIFGLLPQSVDAQLMRMNGRLDSWSIADDLAGSLEILPQEMTSLQIVDPASTYRILVGLAPTLLSAVEMGMRNSRTVHPAWRMPVDAASIPPAELVVQPLFINVGVATNTENGWQAFSRQSLPGIPFVGGAVGPGMGVSTTAVLTALLLPAVQNAREAARISQSKNNMKQIGLAIHNYHDVHVQLPEGTIPNASLQTPEEQLSWMVSLLPYVDQARLYNKIDRQEGWQAEENQDALENHVPIFLNPNQTNQGEGPFGKTNYVGIAGLGEDGPNLPVTDAKAGVFGYDRPTRFRDIRDGTSNTMMVSESTEVTPWGQGGPSTIRPFTKKPYLNGPDGIGSPTKKGTNILLVDGAVRTISQDVDPSVIEALSTINGGEIVPEF
ncbi:DUF1559 domain-containing protein [Planctomicrobium sp. SH661]|uniref:DUF1559 domain-containing protein n=1 Tax=Planctomicrobium sp. SH661 TaxID=3448124 RepID=UPI003F5C36FD